jgi:hypothetical protein
MKNFALASALLINGQPNFTENKPKLPAQEQQIVLQQSRCPVRDNVLVQFRTRNNQELQSVCVPNNQEINPNNGQPKWTGIETPRNTTFYRIRVGISGNEEVCAYLHRRRNPNPSGIVKGESVDPSSVNGAFINYISPYPGVFTIESNTFTSNEAPQYPGRPSISIGTGNQCKN